MPYDEEEENIIRHGTLSNWLGYKVYGVLKGQWLVLLALMLGFVGGAVLF